MRIVYVKTVQTLAKNCSTSVMFWVRREGGRDSRKMRPYRWRWMRGSRSMRTPPAQLLALHVDSLPEGGGAEEDGVGGVAKLLQEHVARGGAVEEESVREFGEETFVGVAHLGVAGEEAEGPALGDLEDAADAFGGFFGEIGLARVGHVWREIEEGLFFVVEVRRDNEFACGGEAEATADVVEAA
jgi:hypothetical protein